MKNKILKITLYLLFIFNISVLAHTFFFEPKFIIEKKVENKTDAMPLENGSDVFIEIIDGQKFITLTLDDLEYLSKRKSRVKELYENLTALFERMEE